MLYWVNTMLFVPNYDHFGLNITIISISYRLTQIIEEDITNIEKLNIEFISHRYNMTTFLYNVNKHYLTITKRLFTTPAELIKLTL